MTALLVAETDWIMFLLLAFILTEKGLYFSVTYVCIPMICCNVAEHTELYRTATPLVGCIFYTPSPDYHD
jgi:hypothetical protein